MKISNTALLGVFLSITAFTVMAMPKAAVYVIYPLDEEGNLKVGIQSINSEPLVVIPNSSFTDALSNFTFWRTTPSQDGYYLTVDVDGWRNAYLYWYWYNPDYNHTVHSQHWVYFYSRVSEIPHHVVLPTSPSDSSPRFLEGSIELKKWSPSPKAIKIKGSLLDIDLYVWRDAPSSNATIGICLYLTQ